MNASDFELSSYNYELPEERIAQYPPKERGTSRLMVLDRASGRNIHSTFSRLGEFLPKGALLVANNSCVVPARLVGFKPSGGKAELLLLTPPPLLVACAVTEEGGWSRARAEVLLRPSRSIRVGDRLTFGDCIAAEVLNKKERMRLVAMLEQRNAFSYRKSVPYVAKHLGVSRYTVYKYLGEITDHPETE